MSREKILCIHNNPLFYQIVNWILSRDDRFGGVNAVELANNEPLLQSRIASEAPDVVLLDLALPQRGAVELTRYAVQKLETPVVLVVSERQSSEIRQQLLQECIDAGIQALVLEESALEDLGDALFNVSHQKMFCSPGLLETMMQGWAQYARALRWQHRHQPMPLTQRELEILQWIAEGMSNKEVARKLKLSLFTVKSHVQKILSKLQATDRNEAVERALELHCLSLPMSRLSTTH
jgi:DNA-binding NarL/FixJ family response regulator